MKPVAFDALPIQNTAKFRLKLGVLRPYRPHYETSFLGREDVLRVALSLRREGLAALSIEHPDIVKDHLQPEWRDRVANYVPEEWIAKYEPAVGGRIRV
jgi:hypothetical protein